MTGIFAYRLVSSTTTKTTTATRCQRKAAMKAEAPKSRSVASVALSKIGCGAVNHGGGDGFFSPARVTCTSATYATPLAQAVRWLEYPRHSTIFDTTFQHTG